MRRPTDDANTETNVKTLDVQMIFRRRIPAILTLMLVLNSPSLDAQWSSNASINVRLSTGGVFEVPDTKMVTDGSGGAIIVWADLRSGPSYVYAQHINASGVVLWTANGLRVCTSTGAQVAPDIATDGAGGAIICWSDLRGQFSKIYAQRVDGAGSLLWSSTGVLVGSANANELLPAIVEDGSGGAIIAWGDFRDDVAGTGDINLYGQRIDTSGIRIWNTNDVRICGASLEQINPVIVSNGNAGAIVVWEDYRNGNQSSDVYAQGISSSGSVMWTTDGTLLCGATNYQLNIKALADGAGGAFAVWTDLRVNGQTGDIYGQHVNSSGVTQWTADGAVICGIPSDQLHPEIISDDASGSIVSWADSRAGVYNIYAQRLNSSGVAQWQVNGVAVTSNPNSMQFSQKMINDGSGNAIFTWEDSPPGALRDIYAQKLDASGVPQWSAAGTLICNQPDNQNSPLLVSDGFGGAIISWVDSRDSTGQGLYAQNVDSTGFIGSFRILAGVVGPGSIIPSGVVLVSGGGTQPFVLIPTSQNQVDSVIVDGANVGTSTFYAFTDVLSNHTIDGYFSSPPSIAVVSPNGGELLQIGSIDTIKWTSSNLAGNVNIKISRDGGTTVSTIVSSIPNSGTYPWLVSAPPTTQALIGVISAADTNIYDVGDGTFTISASGSAGGVLTGNVTDASNGLPLQNATVTIAGISAVTNSSGDYTITGIPPGALRAEFWADTVAGDPPLGVQFHDLSTEGTHSVIAMATGFLPYRNDDIVIDPGDTVNLSFSMSHTLAAGAMRFVLNWGADPSDLDSYLATPLIGGQQYLIYYGNQGRATDVPYDTLDYDITTGFGPETVTMYRFYSGTYHYFVNKFSGSGELTTSGGTVQIYSDAGLIQTIHVPTVGTGEYWNVCDIDGATKNITIINQIVTSPPGNSAQFKVPAHKTSPRTLSGTNPTGVATINSWLWNFGDGTTSTIQNPRHLYQQIGLYTVSLQVTNDTSQDIETKTDFIAVGSVIRVSFVGNGLTSNNQNVSVSPPTGFQPTDAKLFYRLGGAVQYDSVALDTSSIPYTGTIPASAVTPRGLEYYVSITGTAGTGEQTTITSPSSNPATSPHIQQVRVGVTQSATVLLPHTYKMVSVPVNLNNPGVRQVLVDDFGGYDARHWRLFRWIDSSYVEYPGIDSSFVPGRASWLITNQGGRFDVDSGLSVISGSPYTVVLDTGWNQIADPFAFPVAWSDVQKGRLVRGPYFFDGNEYILDTLAVLSPWDGYFVKNDEGETSPLVFPSLAADQTLGRATGSPASSIGAFTLRMIAEVPGTHFRDAQNYLGLVSDARDDIDSYDYPDPPGIDPNVHLSIMQGTTSYLRNFKPSTSEGESWDVQIRSDVSASQVTITLSETGQLPDGFRMYVLDRTDFNIISPQDNHFTVQLEGPQSVRSLKVILGTPVYAAGNSEGIPLAPVNYALEQNYPNPFNPTTTIRYQLSKRSDVSLEIYNLLGQRVRTLVHGEQVTGGYSVTWKSDNDGGGAVASGVYIYRLRAGEFVQSKKLLLLR